MGDFVRSAGGLPAAIKALLTPKNIREGVHIKGGGVDVMGNCFVEVLFSGAAADGCFGNWYNDASASVTYKATRDCHAVICSSHGNDVTGGTATNITGGNAVLSLNSAVLKQQALLPHNSTHYVNFVQKVRLSKDDVITANTNQQTTRDPGNRTSSVTAMTVFALTEA